MSIEIRFYTFISPQCKLNSLVNISKQIREAAKVAIDLFPHSFDTPKKLVLRAGLDFALQSHPDYETLLKKQYELKKKQEEEELNFQKDLDQQNREIKAQTLAIEKKIEECHFFPTPDMLEDSPVSMGEEEEGPNIEQLNALIEEQEKREKEETEPPSQPPADKQLSSALAAFEPLVSDSCDSKYLEAEEKFLTLLIQLIDEQFGSALMKTLKENGENRQRLQLQLIEKGIHRHPGFSLSSYSPHADCLVHARRHSEDVLAVLLSGDVDWLLKFFSGQDPASLSFATDLKIFAENWKLYDQTYTDEYLKKGAAALQHL